MPVISRFYGITVMMFYDEHNPPHFHIRYGEYKAVFSISPLQIVAGEAPNRAVALVFEWAATHQDELLANWERCWKGLKPSQIAPLD